MRSSRVQGSRRVVTLAIAGAVAITPALTGCGAGSEPQSAAPTQLTEGVNVSVPLGAAAPQVDIRNMFVLGPVTGQRLAAGSAAPLYAVVINKARAQDRLLGVSSPSFAVSRIAGGGVLLPAAVSSGTATSVALGGTTGQPPAVALTGLTQPLLGGEQLKLTLRFERAGSVTVTVPVVPRNGVYTSYAPVPTPTATPTRATPSGSPSSPGATSSPATSPTPTTSPTG